MLKNLKEMKPEASNFKCMVIGGLGTGKSVFASSFPKPLCLFDMDRKPLIYAGLDVDAYSYEGDFKSWVEFQKDVDALVRDFPNHNYKTVVLDTTTPMLEMAMEFALKKFPSQNANKDLPEFSHYACVKNLVAGILRKLRNLPCNLVILTHTQVVKDEVGGRIFVAPMLTGKLAVQLPGFFDEVYYADSEIDSQGKLSFYLQTAPAGYYRARSALSGRTGKLPAKVPNNYDKLMEEVRKIQK